MTTILVTTRGAPGADPTFPDGLLGLVEKEGVDVVLPESSHDLRHLAPRRGEFPVPAGPHGASFLRPGGIDL